MPLYSKNISFMISAISDAAKSITRDFYEISRLQSSQNVDGVKKFSEQAYSKANSALINKLQDARPEFGFSQKDEKKYYWRLIAIDGLYNFSRSLPHFSICIALYQFDEMIAIAIGLPILKEMFWAEKGYGAYLEEQNTTIKLRINNNKAVDKSSVVALNGINGKIFQALQGMQYRITGSTYTNMAYVAAGKFDAVLYMKEESDNSLLIKEAYGNATSGSNYNIVGNHKVTSILSERLQDDQKN